MFQLAAALSTTCIVLFCCLLFGSASCLTVKINGSAEFSALMAFKSKLILEPYSILSTNWTSNTHYCTWYGVSCSDHRVTELALPGKDLRGELSPQIANLSHLEVLDLSGNELGGTLPSELGSLQQLSNLDVSNNSLQGGIPTNLSRCWKLKILNLGDNWIAGSVPEELGYLENLEQLKLGGNNLTGNIPTSFGNFSRLRYFYLQENYLDGAVPSELGKLTTLTNLAVWGNNLIGPIPPSIFNISKLKVLDPSENELSGQLPHNLGERMPNLERLLLSTNQLTGKIPSSICNATRLVYLELSTNSFSGHVPMMLGNLVDLESLNLYGNSFIIKPDSTHLDFLKSMVNCRNLESIIISDNPLHGKIPESIGNISTNLNTFWAGYCGLKGHIPHGFGNLSSLNAFYLSDNKLKGSIPISFSSLRNLESIYVTGNKLEGSIPAVVCSIPLMGFLFLGHNNFSGSIPTCFQNLTHLRAISLAANKLSSTIPLDFWKIVNVLELYLYGNLLHGTVPAEVGNLRAITIMDLSSNDFSGEIPNSIGSLQNLLSLNMSGNNFQGPIPNTLSSLIVIQYLNLSSNFLSGDIPASLGSLRDLQYLNLSFNILQGEIPNTGVFANITFQSLMGNGNLCGAPNLNFPVCPPRASGKRKGGTSFVLKITVPIVATSLLVFAMVLLWIKISTRRAKIVTEPEISLAEHRMITYHELVRATQNFSVTNIVGEGSSGMVYRGELSDGTVAAIKVFNMQYVKALGNFDAECEVLRNVRHRNLVRIISTCTIIPEFKAMILDFMPNGSLDMQLHSRGSSLSLAERLDIMTDVALGVEYLHHEYDVPIVHCDLKPGNILLDGDMTAHVADFGISKILAEDQEFILTRTLGTIGYMAPEYGLDGHASTKGDVYSFGILLLETFTGKRPTDDMFTEGLSLHRWVHQVFPDALVDVIDSRLFADIISSREDGSSASRIRKNQRVEELLVSIIQVAFLCLKELPDDRIDMRGAAAQLKKIKAGLEKQTANNARRSSAY